MRRGQAATWIAAWLLGVGLAMLVAWLGVRAVIHSTTGPVVPVVDPSPVSVPRVSVPRVSVPRVSGRPGASPPAPAATTPPAGRASVTPASSPAQRTPKAPATSPSPAGPADVRTYTMTGGLVTLQVTSTNCILIAAMPDLGYSVQNWSSMGWLRVDFSQDGNEVSSLICDWYQQAPTVTIGS